MARMIPVLLTYDPATQTVAPTNPEQTAITLENFDDWVVWEFDPDSPLPPGNAALLIRFETPLGPFQSIRGAGLQSLVAKGNKGDALPVTYTYFLYLNIPGSDSTNNLHQSGPFTIENQCADGNASPWVTVTFTPPDPSAPPGTLGTLDPQPSELLLHDGDTAFVEFLSVPDDHVVAFWFPGEGSSEGPFSTYFVTRKGGSGTLRLGGATFNQTTPRTLSYGARIWNADGVLVGRQDPSIDGLGRPPSTTT
jgi:hypothetical protein